MITQQTSRRCQGSNSTTRSGSQKSTTDRSSHSALLSTAGPPGSLLKLSHTGDGHGLCFGFAFQPRSSSSAKTRIVGSLDLRYNCLLLGLVNTLYFHPSLRVHLSEGGLLILPLCTCLGSGLGLRLLVPCCLHRSWLCIGTDNIESRFQVNWGHTNCKIDNTG